jgi:chromosome segregation ATPase
LARLNGRDCRDGAIAGGLLGGLAGNQIGQAAAEAKRDLVKADETLAKLRGVQQKLSGIETSLQAVLRRQNSEISSLRRQLAAGQVTQSAVNSRIGSINSNRAAVINGLQAGETNIAREKAELVSLERESGQNLRTTKRAVDSTQARIRSLRNTVRIVSN